MWVADALLTSSKYKLWADKLVRNIREACGIKSKSTTGVLGHLSSRNKVRIEYFTNENMHAYHLTANEHGCSEPSGKQYPLHIIIWTNKSIHDIILIEQGNHYRRYRPFTRPCQMY